MKALEETVSAVRRLLGGEMVTLDGDWIHLDQVRMQMTPESVPPLYIGAMREKSFRLAGRLGDGTILTGMSSPAYIRWALGHIRAGLAESGRTQHRVVVSIILKVDQDGKAARAAVRRSLAELLPWNEAHVKATGIEAEVANFVRRYDTIDEAAQNLPDEWVDAFAAAGTPEQVTDAIQRWVETGVDSIVFQPLFDDPDCLEEYIRYLSPLRELLG